jgi:hypothetical protein
MCPRDTGEKLKPAGSLPLVILSLMVIVIDALLRKRETV